MNPFTIAIIGLGNLGLAIARRLEDVLPGLAVGIDPAEGARRRWEALSGRAALENLDSLSSSSLRRVFVLVYDESQAGAVLRHISDTWSPGPGQQSSVFVCTTLSPVFAARLDEYERAGLSVLELPLTGGEAAARSGALTAMAWDGLAAADERFLVGTVAARVVRFRRRGEATLAKLLSQAVIAYQVAALDAATAAAATLDVDPRSLLDVIRHGSASSRVSTAIESFSASTLDKDVQLLRDHGVALPTIDASRVGQRFADLRPRLAGPGV